MINKLTLQNIISKYYLNGLIESVKWSIKNEVLKIKFMSPSRDMIGELEFEGFKTPDVDLAVFNTTQLNKLIGITQGTLLLNINKQGNIANRLNIQDNQYDLTYALADTLLVGKVGKVDEPSQYDVETTLTSEHIAALIKAKSALPDTNNVIINSNTNFNGDSVLEFILGDNGEYSNKITYLLPSINNLPISLPFDADILKEILSANKDAESGILNVYSGGLLKVGFTNNDKSLKVTYFLVRKQE
jgi:hypothetical protein